jgi:hypothetical protein
MVTHSTQMVALTKRPSQPLASLKGLDAYFFPYGPSGTVVCERTSEAIDVRIIQILPITEFKPGFSFSAFMHAAEANHVLARCRPVL